MFGAIMGVLAIVVFVTAHEAGHFIAAKATGMKATEFFFGFGPRLWSFRRGETEYGIKAIPAGGYVRIIGMNPFEEIAPEDMGRTYREKSFSRKAIVVLAGVGMNFLIAYLMFTGLSMWVGDLLPTTTVEGVVADVDGVPTPAAEAGVVAGDVVTAIDGAAVPDWESLSIALAERPDQDVELTVERLDGSVVDIDVAMTSRLDPETGDPVGFLGIRPSFIELPVGIFDASGRAAREVYDNVVITFQVMGKLVQPESLARLAGVFVGNTDVPDDIRPVSPIGLANIGSQADRIGIANYVGLLASINVILATFNVLPLLPLDGGHFAVALWEKVTGREPDVRKLMPVAVAVILLFSFLGLAAMILDIIDPISL